MCKSTARSRDVHLSMPNTTPQYLQSLKWRATLRLVGILSAWREVEELLRVFSSVFFVLQGKLRKEQVSESFGASRSTTKMPPRTLGIFISIEGLDGSGKTTQARQLKKWLKELDFEVKLTHEPGGTAIGEQVREVLHRTKNREMHPKTELLLYNASRAQLVEEVIKPHLHKGGVVVCDRFADSGRAYQLYGRELTEKDSENVIRFATGDLQPDLTILLDLTPKRAFARRLQASLNGEGWNRMDDQEIEFRRRVYEGYKALAEKDKDRWKVVDGKPSIAEVSQAVKEQVEKKFPDRFRSIVHESRNDETTMQDHIENVTF